MKFGLSCRLAAVWCACGLLLAGCEAGPPAQTADRADRPGRSLNETAESFEKRRDYATAVSHYRNLHRRDQTEIGAVVGLSRNLRHMQQASEAQAIVLRAMKDAPKDTDLRAEFGKVQLALGEPLKAIDTLSRLDAEMDGQRWDIKIAMAIAYDRIGMYEQAERRYRQALVLSPENAIIMNNFALSLAQAGRLAEATEILGRAAALPEATARMRQNLALLYAMMGNLDLAEKYVRRDLPPDVADQNMAYYRQLHADMAAGNKALPLSSEPVTMLPSRTPPPAEIAAVVGAAEKSAIPDRTPASLDTAQQEAAQPKMTTPKRPVMAAPDKMPGPALEPMSRPEPKPAKEPAAKIAGKDAGISAIAPVQAPKVKAQESAMKATATRAAEALPAHETKPDAETRVKEPVVASGATKGYRLQLGSFRSIVGAETLRTRLLKEHRDLLQGLELLVETVAISDRGDFFRVNSRPMPDRGMVNETCLRLAIRDVPCLLVTVP
ncbi:MAG: SPOR domain-containing protein [Proteobacteria bacterium]|nr:SPOR domain-containing protein [Pseudomonadota bacterium]